jgi:hypothetical protein
VVLIEYMRPYQLDFYATLGLAISQWAHVEDNLLGLYWVAMGEPDDPAPVAATFYSAVAFAAKLSMTDAAMQVRYHGKDEVLSNWKRFRKRLSERSTLRNQLAHFMARWDQVPGEDQNFIGRLVPHLYNPNQSKTYKGDKAPPARTAEDIEAVRLQISKSFSVFRDFRALLDRAAASGDSS